MIRAAPAEVVAWYARGAPWAAPARVAEGQAVVVRDSAAHPLVSVSEVSSGNDWRKVMTVLRRGRYLGLRWAAVELSAPIPLEWRGEPERPAPPPAGWTPAATDTERRRRERGGARFVRALRAHPHADHWRAGVFGVVSFHPERWAHESAFRRDAYGAAAQAARRARTLPLAGEAAYAACAPGGAPPWRDTPGAFRRLVLDACREVRRYADGVER